MTKYKILLADPPWEYNNKWNNDPKNGGITYPTMTQSDLFSLKPLIDQIMDKDSCLLLWATFPKLKEGIDVLEAWGFRYITVPFTWLKKNRDGSNYSGLGSHTNSNQEIVLLGKRGKGCPRVAKNVKQVIEAPRGIHSSKPTELYRRIEALYGTLPRLELFARNMAPGWDCMGNELSGMDIKDELMERINGTWIQR